MLTLISPELIWRTIATERNNNVHQTKVQLLQGTVTNRLSDGEPVV